MDSVLSNEVARRIAADLTTLVSEAEKHGTLPRIKSVAIYFNETELRTIIKLLRSCHGILDPAQTEREPTEDEQIVDRINYLRGGEGDSVTILCDNPDFNGQPERVVECCGDWTRWEERRYGGDTLLGALNAAWLECMQWRTALQYGREKGPTLPSTNCGGGK